MRARERRDTNLDRVESVFEPVGIDGFKHGIDTVGDFLHLGFVETAGRHRRRAEANTGCFKGRASFKWHRVFITRDMGKIEGLLSQFGGKVRKVVTEIDKEEVIVTPSGNNFVATLQKCRGECLAILHHIGGVFLELGLEGFGEANGLGRDHVHEGTTLAAREHGGVDGLHVFGFAEDQTTTRSAESFVGRRGDEICVRNRGRMHAAGHESGNVGDVGEQVGADRAGDLTHALKINDPRVGRSADGDHLRLFAFGNGCEFIVVDVTGFLVYAVLHEVVEFAGEVGGITVGEVPPVSEVHAENFVARLQNGRVDREVGLGAGVRLHVGVLGPEKFFGAFDGDDFDFIDFFAAPIPAFGRVAFGVFVGENAALGFHYRGVSEVFRGDQFDVIGLTGVFGRDGSGNFRIEGGERRGSQHGVETEIIRNDSPKSQTENASDAIFVPKFHRELSPTK